eukprot:gb/GEZN01004674.1/.p1 GENE.gb/GEZN01004674.1/~~gb/GEZN01004674.1/.p1  ORF type:complete len:479 (-),score=33.30 gb/GEZN01004674.1/:370-1806(-)
MVAVAFPEGLAEVSMTEEGRVLSVVFNITQQRRRYKGELRAEGSTTPEDLQDALAEFQKGPKSVEFNTSKFCFIGPGFKIRLAPLIQDSGEFDSSAPISTPPMYLSPSATPTMSPPMPESPVSSTSSTPSTPTNTVMVYASAPATVKPLGQMQADFPNNVPPKKRHACHLCEKTYAKAVSLKAHIRTHTGERPFECSFCGQGFTRKCDMKHHEMIHTGHKPYKCHTCDKTFRQAGQLSAHARSHSGEKPYSCAFPDCGRTFARKSDLLDHNRTHTRENPFKCQVCGKEYVQSRGLATHMKTHVSSNPATDKKKSLIGSHDFPMHDSYSPESFFAATLPPPPPPSLGPSTGTDLFSHDMPDFDSLTQQQLPRALSMLYSPIHPLDSQSDMPKPLSLPLLPQIQSHRLEQSDEGHTDPFLYFPGDGSLNAMEPAGLISPTFPDPSATAFSAPTMESCADYGPEALCGAVTGLCLGGQALT